MCVRALPAPANAALKLLSDSANAALKLVLNVSWHPQHSFLSVMVVLCYLNSGTFWAFYKSWVFHLSKKMLSYSATPPLIDVSFLLILLHFFSQCYNFSSKSKGELAPAFTNTCTYPILVVSNVPSM